MSRKDCVSNRNTKIIATYVRYRLGSVGTLFDNISFPKDKYSTARLFFLNEDEWTTFENFTKIFRKAKEMVGETDFFFKCGISSARFGSWGRFEYFVRVFATPSDGYKRLPFFSRNFNDTKDIEVIKKPAYDRNLKKIKTTLKITFHDDFDCNKDYIGDSYLRGIVSSIPTIWGLPPASTVQPLVPYDPEILFNQEPEFSHYHLNAKIEENRMSMNDPETGQRMEVGKRVILTPETIEGKVVFLGKYTEFKSSPNQEASEEKTGIVITKTVHAGKETLLQKGEIFSAPYIIINISYDRLSWKQRFAEIFKIRKNRKDSGKGLFDTIDQLRGTIIERNDAYRVLKKTNEELRTAKLQLREYNLELEKRVEKRTLELQKAKQNLLQMNQDLEVKVRSQVIELEKHNHLRRYLSPKIAEEILSSGAAFGTKPKRKFMTVAFTDIRDFSHLTDTLEPEEIFQLLGQYMCEMIKIVHEHDGTLNKIIGDGLLIVFGDPVSMDDHANRALKMAIEMQKKILDLRNEWLRYGHPLSVGIGINTGYMTVGNIGSETHRDYTVIGNQVNVAGRLETLAGAGEILISQRTASHVTETIDLEERGDIQVRGIHEPVKTWKVRWEES